MKLLKYLNWLLLLAITILACKDGEEVIKRSYPSIDTERVTDINENGATLRAEILNLGNSGVIDHGFIYSLFTSPTLDGSDRISLGETTQKGSFSAIANRNLNKDTKYYVRAYAISKTNFIVYGQQVEFISQGSSAPEISNFDLKEGVIGDTILIVGSGFSNVKTNNLVFFGGAIASVVKATSDSLWCEVPLNTASGENEISLKVGQLLAKTDRKFLLKSASIISILPTNVSFGDTLLINGNNFPRSKNFVESTLLDKSALVINATINEIKVIVSNSVAITESKVFLKIGLQEIASQESVKLLKPVVTNFLPAKGTNNTEVTINGNYFNPISTNNKVTLNGVALQVIQASKTSLKVKIPSGILPGNYPISINVATQVTNSPTNFEIVKPVITMIAPLQATWGNIITIGGENFGTGITDNIVLFGEVEGLVVDASSTELKVRVPNNLLTKNSTISIRAKTIDNQIASFIEPFVLLAPIITNFTPDQGKSKSQVTINGQNFNPVSSNQTVMFGDRMAEVISSTSNQLIVKLPTSLIDSNVQIKIEVAEQVTTSTNLFHLVSPWRKIANLPGDERYDATSFAIGNYGYVGSGFNNGFEPAYVKRFWNYDPTNDMWSEIAGYNFPGEGTGSPFVNMVSIVIDGNSFVGLGSVGYFSVEGRIRRYNPTANTWSDAMGIGNNPSLYGTDGAIAYSINGKGYVTTGREFNNVTSKKMWEYDPNQDLWLRKADLPGSARMESTGFSIGAKVYLTMGTACPNCTGDLLLKDVWEYDVSLDKWRQLGNFPGIKRMKASAFSINGEGFMIGGQTYEFGEIFLKDFWKYNVTLDSWIQLEDFPGGERTAATTFVINNKAYFGTGIAPNGATNDFWEFDPSKL